MKILSSTIWMDYRLPPVTGVMAETDMRDTLESTRIQLRDSAPESLLIFDVFDVPDDTDIVRYTAMAMERRDVEREHHMATLFFWTVEQWRHVRPGGMLAMDRPAPLSADDMGYVFERLQNHPAYKEYGAVAFARDGTPVTMKGAQ